MFSLKEELENFWGRCEAAWPTPARATNTADSMPSPAWEPDKGAASSPERAVETPRKRGGTRSGGAMGGRTKRSPLQRVRFVTSRNSGQHHSSHSGRCIRSPSIAKCDSDSTDRLAKRRKVSSKASSTAGRAKEQPVRASRSESSSNSTAHLKKRRKTRAFTDSPALGKVRESKGRAGSAGTGNWDRLPCVEDVIVQQRTMPTYFPRKRRECYCGNLTAGRVDHEVLRNAFYQLFNALPVFHEMYPDVSDPVRSLAFDGGKGCFAFVEFYDETIAGTAVLMSGFELLGRPVKVGRPAGYIPPPYGELPPLDVTPLRRAGLIPFMPEVITPSVRNMSTSRICELYVGNLVVGKVTEAVMEEFLTPVCVQMPEYNAALGKPILKVAMAPSGCYCFVEFQCPDMASQLIPVLDGTELFGRKMRVGRPTNYELNLNAAKSQEAITAPLTLPALPAPPAPPVESEVVRAGAAVSGTIETVL